MLSSISSLEVITQIRVSSKTCEIYNIVVEASRTFKQVTEVSLFMFVFDDVQILCKKKDRITPHDKFYKFQLYMNITWETE